MMESKTSSVKPIHIALGVGAIIIAMIALPIASAAYKHAYPEYGTRERSMMDECVEQAGPGVRWNVERLEQCKAYNAIRRRNGG